MTCRVILEFTLVRNRTAVCSGQSLIRMACRDILKFTQVRNLTFEGKFLYFEESFQVMLPFKVVPPNRLFAEIWKNNLVRRQCCGSVKFWYGFRCGSRSSDSHLWLLDPDAQKHTDPNPDADPEHWCIYIILQGRKFIMKSLNSRNRGFLTSFAWWWKDPDRSRFRTCDYNESGCESGRAKNIWILRIRICCGSGSATLWET